MPARDAGAPGTRGAVRLVARAELRERGWSLLALGVVLGLVGGVVLGAVAVGERTATAYPRLVEAVHLDDARLIVPADRPALIEALPTLPGVADAWLTEAWVAQVGGPQVQFMSLAAGTASHPGLVTPVVVDGRAADPAAADEVVVSERVAEHGMGVGTVLPLRMLTLEDMARFAVGFTPHGPATTVRVVGVARMPAWGQALPDVLAGPAFARALAGTGIGHSAYVRLDPGPDAAARFDEAVAAFAAAQPSIVGEYLTPGVEHPRAPDPAVQAAERALLLGVGLFALVVGLGALQVVGLGLLRTAGTARAARSVESALGMTAAQSVAARVGAAVPAAAVAGLLGAGVVVAAGTLAPLGSQARFEPEPGFRPQWALALAGGAALAALFLLVTAAAAAFAWRRRALAVPEPAVPREGSLAAVVGGSLGRWPTLLLGSRLAQAGTRRGVPPLVTTLAATAAVAGIVATVTVGASLDRLVATPERWAGGADITIADSREPDVVALAEDPRVAILAITDTSYARLGSGGTLGIVSITARKGTPPVALVSGRLPTAADEVAVNPRLAAERGLSAGERIDTLATGGAPHPMTVVGVAVVPNENHGPLGQDLLATGDGLRAVSPERNFPLLTTHVYARPGAAAALAAELGGRLELAPPTVPDAIRNLGDLGRLPDVLAVVLAVVAGTGLAHSLLVGARRLAREMAVFSVLGATPGQVRITLGVLAASTAVPAVLLGVPAGLGVARLFWWQVASTIGVGGDIAVPVGPIALLIAAVPLGAALVAAVPARRVRTPAATSLAAL
ncbi:ABC transporter permease [Pseudonocardia sp. RS11V-5]|uniref:ABC transporter permease n=1 Tax=Pseudonocardia terrae TaxID=2905831 RepID=UPI001E50C5BF|nr:ABC transporter permease [Pseudonocardia terrae]MCE3555965.1 ABC transporter permease [Pseudonocardia terrae]